MTLVLSYLCPDYVLQVSDRRLVSLPRGTIASEDAVKAVLFSNHTAFAYTGLAELPRSKKARKMYDDPHIPDPLGTNRWLAETFLLGNSVGSALEAVREEATLCVRRIRVASHLKSHSFIGVGWTSERPDDPLEPGLYVVTNTFDGKIQGQFATGILRLDGEPFLFNASTPLRLGIWSATVRRLESCHDRGTGPSAVSRVLLETVREVADADKQGTVGRAILRTCLPRAALEKVRTTGGDWQLSALPANLEHVTVGHVPATAAEGQESSPTVVLEPLITEQIKLGHNVVNLKDAGVAGR